MIRKKSIHLREKSPGKVLFVFLFPILGTGVSKEVGYVVYPVSSKLCIVEKYIVNTRNVSLGELSLKKKTSPFLFA
jgi:hypothetical protein